MISPVAIALALAALALPLSIAGSNIALGLLTLALLARAKTDGRAMLSAWRSEPVLAALAAYAAAGLLAAVFSTAPGPSLRDAIKDLHRFWSLSLFTAALALEPNAPLLPAFALSFGGVAALGCGQVLLALVGEGAVVRAHATVHPVVYGEQMALAVLGGFCISARPDSRAIGRRALTLGLMILCAAALVLSQTRMALFAAAFGFAALAFIEPRARRWGRPMLAVIIGAALLWEFLPYGGRALSTLFHYDAGNPQQARWTLWDAAWRMFRDHPWTGAGPGGYSRLFTDYVSGPLDGETRWGSAHNLYLHQLAERGSVGGAALLALIGCLAARGFLAARRSTDARALWGAASIAAFCVFSLTETSFQNEQFSTLLLLIWAWSTRDLRS